MKYLSVALLCITLILGGYSLFYEQEVRKAERRMGFAIPTKLQKLLRLNVYLALIISVILGILLLF